MKKLLIEKIPRITKNKKNLEQTLNVKITNRGKEVFIDGPAEKEFLAEKVLEALNFGFPYSHAIELAQETTIFEIINIKDHTKRTDLERIRARIIGTKGKTLKTLCTLTNCYIEIKDNKIGIIGEAQFIQNATQAIISLVQGSKQGNVYAHLEKLHPKFEPDLGLREKNDVDTKTN